MTTEALKNHSTAHTDGTGTKLIPIASSSPLPEENEKKKDHPSTFDASNSPHKNSTAKQVHVKPTPATLEEPLLGLIIHHPDDEANVSPDDKFPSLEEEFLLVETPRRVSSTKPPTTKRHPELKKEEITKTPPTFDSSPLSTDERPSPTSGKVTEESAHDFGSGNHEPDEEPTSSIPHYVTSDDFSEGSGSLEKESSTFDIDPSTSTTQHRPSPSIEEMNWSHPVSSTHERDSSSSHPAVTDPSHLPSFVSSTRHPKERFTSVTKIPSHPKNERITSSHMTKRPLEMTHLTRTKRFLLFNLIILKRFKYLFIKLSFKLFDDLVQPSSGPRGDGLFFVDYSTADDQQQHVNDGQHLVDRDINDGQTVFVV